MRKNYSLFHYDSLTRIHRTSLFNYSFKFYPMLHIVKKNKNSNLFCRLQVIVFMLSEAARKMLRKRTGQCFYCLFFRNLRAKINK